MENKKEITVCIGHENYQEVLLVAVLSNSVSSVRQIVCRECKALIDEGEFTPNELQQMLELTNRTNNEI